MINALYHAATAATVQFPANPLRGNGDTIARRQVSGFDSDGNMYVYERNAIQQRDIPLIYNNLSDVVLDQLLVFMQSRNGDKHSFTWYDHDAAAHTVRFGNGSISFKEIGPGRYRSEFGLVEET